MHGEAAQLSLFTLDMQRINYLLLFWLDPICTVGCGSIQSSNSAAILSLTYIVDDSALHSVWPYCYLC
jgi:hypothetical protein